MKKCLSILIITIMMIALSSIGSRAVEPIETVTQFFNASKNEDVETMRHLIAGPFYSKRKVLLEVNKDYPEFLKTFYDGVSLEPIQYDVGNIDMLKTKHPDLYNRHYTIPPINRKDSLKSGKLKIAIAIVKFNFPDGSHFISKFLLKAVKNEDWKIYEELLVR